MQNFFNFRGKEERTKLIQCIAEKIAILTKQVDTVNNRRNYFSWPEPSPLRTTGIASGAVDGGMDLFSATGWDFWPDHMPSHAQVSLLL